MIQLLKKDSLKKRQGRPLLGFEFLLGFFKKILKKRQQVNMLRQALKSMSAFKELQNYSKNKRVKNKKPIIEVLTTGRLISAGFRLRLYAILQHKKSQFHFCQYGEGGEDTRAILINKRQTLRAIVDTKQNPFRQRRPHAVVMLLISDFVESEFKKYQELPSFVDVILVPTKIMKYQLEAIAHCKVEVLKDAIDFDLNDSRSLKKSMSTQALKVVWFGRAESYAKSMRPYEAVIKTLVEKGDITFHLIANAEVYETGSFFTVHRYEHKTFLKLLTSFDVCIVNHMPMDFSMSTYWKSENKALLAINRGLPVLASRTPAYEDLLSTCGLSQYLFSSPHDLKRQLLQLKSLSHRKAYLAKSQSYILKHYTSYQIANDWATLFHEWQKIK